jgi:hypothetical protein
MIMKIAPTVATRITMNVPHVGNGWMNANMFIDTQMYISSDMYGNLCVDPINFLPHRPVVFVGETKNV